MDLTDKKCIFYIVDKVKQLRVGKHVKPLEFLSYPNDERLCVIRLLQQYLKKTAELRNSQQLLISYVKPHRPVSKDTIARWCKSVLDVAEVDTSKFKSHSTRAVLSSHLAECLFKIQDILASAGWSMKTPSNDFTTSHLNLTYKLITQYSFVFRRFLISP